MPARRQSRATTRPRTASLIDVDRLGTVVEAVKRADREEALVVRIYEAWGTRGPATVRFGLPVRQATRTDLLERDVEALGFDRDHVTLQLRPFEIVTLKLQHA